MNDTELSELYTEAMRARASGEREACPPVEALEALVQRRGDDAARVATLDHAMSCQACRRELELLRSIQVATPARRAAVPQWASLAAGTVLVVGLATWMMMRPPAPDALRGADGGNAGGIAVVEAARPALGESLRLVWRPVPGATRYRVEVLTTDGAVMDTASVADTVFSLPPAALASGAAFDWWVSTQLADGRVVRSPLMRVEARR